MNWNCPHCGVLLALQETQIGPGWSFSKCYTCGGFALIRRAEINVIKVDQAPPGEKVLLPERSSDSAVAVLSQEASARLLKIKSMQPPPPPPHLIHHRSPLEFKPQIGGLKRDFKLSKVGVVAAAFVVVFSGANLVMRGNSVLRLNSEPQETSGHSTPPTQISDQGKPLIDSVHENAMAPLREEPEQEVNSQEDISTPRSISPEELRDHAQIDAANRNEYPQNGVAQNSGYPPQKGRASSASNPLLPHGGRPANQATRRALLNPGESRTPVNSLPN